MAFKELGCAAYTPSLPLMAASLGGSPEELRNLMVQHDLTVNMKGKISQGAVSLTMNSFEEPYRSPITNQIFNRTMDWTFRSTGFDNMPMTEHMILEELSIRMGMDQLTYISIVISFNLLDQLAIILSTGSVLINNVTKGIGSLLLGDGKFTISMELKGTPPDPALPTGGNP